MSAAHDLAALRLWQLISPALPVGAYAYSQGLEYAAEAAWLRDAAQLEDWIGGLMETSVSGLDVPVLRRLLRAWEDEDGAALQSWSEFILAAREARELQMGDRQLGQALARLLADLGVAAAAPWRQRAATNFVVMYALAVVHWRIPAGAAAQAYVWNWCENQVAAALKLQPIGQTAGQALLHRIAARIPAAVARGWDLADDAIGVVAPGLAIASARHETQYTRLFRS